MPQLYIAKPNVNDIVDAEKPFVVLGPDDLAELPTLRRWWIIASNYVLSILCAIAGVATPAEQIAIDVARSLRMELALIQRCDENAVAWTDAELERLELFAKYSEDPQLQGLVRQAKAAVKALQRDRQTHSNLVDQRDDIIDEICLAAGCALEKANPMGEAWRCPEFAKLAEVVRRYA